MISMARTFGAPTSVPAGKVAANRSKASLPGASSPLHAAHDVHDVAVALDDAVGIDAHASRPRHAAQIVARQIHQHHVLGVFLRIRQQFGLAARHRVAASPPRGREPAMGRSCAWPALSFTSASGEEPTTVMSPSSQKYM